MTESGSGIRWRNGGRWRASVWPGQIGMPADLPPLPYWIRTKPGAWCGLTTMVTILTVKAGSTTFRHRRNQPSKRDCSAPRCVTTVRARQQANASLRAVRNQRRQMSVRSAESSLAEIGRATGFPGRRRFGSLGEMLAHSRLWRANGRPSHFL